MIGGGAKMMLEHGLNASGGIPEGEFKLIYRALLRYYEDHISVHTRPFPGALELLDQFDAWGVRYAVITNKFESLATKVLRDLNLFDRMVTVIGGDTLGAGNAKPSAAPVHEMIKRCGGGKAVFIGDSIYDTLAAKNADIPSIACGFGFLMQPIEELDADGVINHFDELIAMLRGLA
jgi:phosphoglycolate phosphatase